MAVAHDVNTRWPASGTDATTGNRTFSHAGGANIKGVVVVLCGLGNNDLATGVDYGGIALTRVQKAVDTSEAGTVEIWASDKQAVPTGTQTVTIQGANASAKYATCSSVTAGTTQTQVAGSAKVDTTTAANPSVSINTSLAGMGYAGVHTGAAAPATAAATGCTLQHNQDYGQLASNTIRRTAETAAGTVTMGVTLGSDDYCIAGVVLAEYTPPTPISGTDTDGTHVESAKVDVKGEEFLGMGPVLSTGWLPGGAASLVVTGESHTWVNISNAEGTEDGLTAQNAAFESVGASDWLVLVGFGAAIPSGYTIVGVEIRLSHTVFADNTPPSASYFLTKDAGTTVSPNSTSNDGSLGTEQYVTGGPSNLYGFSSISEAEAEHPNFGVVIDVFHLNTQFESSNYDVDAVELKFYYRLAGTPWTTESGSKTTGDGEEKSGTDTDGTHTENAEPLAALPGADTDGTHTETGSPTAALGGLDVDGAGNESGALAGQLPGTDADGVEVESAAALYAIPGTDVDGANTETAAVGQAVIDDTDLGASAVQTGSLAATMAGADADGSETEAGAVTSPVSASDADGAEVESASVVAPKAGADTDGAETESATTIVTPAGTDTDGTHVESGAIGLQGQDADGVNTEVADTIQLMLQVGTDAGSASDASVLVAAIPASESRSVAELAAIALYGADARGTLTEAGTITATIVATDVDGAGAESAVITVTILATDTDGTPTEVGQVTGMVVTVQGNDVGSGQDNAGLIRAIAVFDVSGTPVDLAAALVSFTGIDAAAALEGALLTAQVAGQDVRVAIDLATLLNLISSADASQAVIEEARTALTGQDTSTGAESGVTGVALQGQETAVAGETADLGVMLPALDVGLSVEAALVLIRGLLQAIATGKVVSEVPGGRFGQGSSGRVRS